MTNHSWRNVNFPATPDFKRKASADEKLKRLLLVLQEKGLISSLDSERIKDEYAEVNNHAN